MRRLAGTVILAAAAGWSSAAPVPPPEPGTGTLKGKVRLVPREGVKIPRLREGAYGGGRRTLRGPTVVDYRRPGFVVVYLDRGPAPSGSVQLTLQETRWRRRIEPAYAAVGSGGIVSLRNATAKHHTVSCPALGVVRQIGPGETIELETLEPGPLQVHVLDESLTATVFAAPGPFDVVSKRGRWALRDMPLGCATLSAWHPRFPAVALPVEITPGAALELNLEIGVRAPDALGD